jgi:hypothetical protein
MFRSMIRAGRMGAAIGGIVLMAGASAARAVAPATLWADRHGGTDTDAASAVAVDAEGNVIVAGTFYGVTSFGVLSMISAGFSDIFLVKFDPAGTPLWARRFGNANFDYVSDLAVDPSGQIVITGSFENDINFGGSTLTSQGQGDMYVAKFSASGSHVFSQRYGGSGSESGAGVTVDDSGNMLLAGQTNGTVVFSLSTVIFTQGGYDMLVVRLTSAGSLSWAKGFGGTGDDVARDVAADASGNVFFSGYTNGTVNFGGGARGGAGDDDICLVKLSSAGAHQWSQAFGGTGEDLPRALDVDALGNILLAGTFESSVNFGGSTLVSSGSSDIVLAKYSNAGAHQWSKRFGSSGDDRGFDVSAGPDGSVTLAGVFTSVVNFGGGTHLSSGTWDGFAAVFEADGAYRWSISYGNTGSDRALGVAAAPNGDVLMTGDFVDTVNPGAGPLTSDGSTDVLIARYGARLPAPAITSIEDIGNDQGRRVRIGFAGSGYDDPLSPILVEQYELYRRVDDLPAASAAPGVAMMPGWVYVTSVPAHEEAAYVADATTDADSTVALGQHHSVFFVRATTDDNGLFYDSAPDSGWSLDNLSPGIPQNFAYAAGSLSWDESSAADFDYFTVYGGNTSAFASATPIDYTVAPEMDVNAAPYAYYFVTATDFSGNEGKPAVVNPASSVGGAPREYALTVSAYPNPFNPATTVRYTVPAKGRVEVSVYDARGTRVATLVEADQEAGAYTRTWDGRDGAGRAVSSGIYFARVSHASGTKTYKMVLLK